MTKRRRPNTVERGSRPEVVRFCWIAETEGGSHHSGFTWGGVLNIKRRVGKTIKTLKVVDLQQNRIYEVTDIDGFMEAWADNYDNPLWPISKEPSVRKNRVKDLS